MISENEIPLAKIMRPSFEEFIDFEQFVENIDRDKSFQAYGVIKVVPPAKWKPRKANVTNEFDTLVVNSPIEQNVQGKSGIYELLLIQKKSMKLNDYRKKVECFDSLTNEKSMEEVEDMFWKNIAFSPPLYGADMAGTLFDSRTPWDLNDLPGVLREGLKNPISGVNTPYLYVGSWKTMFGWHKEDIDLYSINYLHYGKPKFWYCLPPSEGKKLEDYAKSLFPEGFSKCKELLRHKTIMMHPYILKQKIPDLKIQKMIQYPGEFVITLGGAYHAGFNWGFNIAEAVNFATSRWLELLPSVSACSCIKDSVKIDKLEFYTNIMLSKYGKTPAIKKICQENGVTKAKLQSRKLEEEEVDSIETADSRGAQTSRRGRRTTPSKIRLLEEEEKIPERSGRTNRSNRSKTVRKQPKKEDEEEEEVEEVVRHRISNRSKKIKKLGEEYDTSDWKKIGRTRNTSTKSKKQTQQERKKKRGKASKQKESNDDLNVSLIGSEEL